ncbi:MULTISPECIES: hypothetical protein [Xanthomonas]|nr:MULTISPECIES: hypothetical protein [Xanthomonas]MDN0221601.1 hypothetical protein [Xanthomonas arboricola pv. juglandis]MDN0246712.1 hypothetical protein [Xanthomonas arboricola pv. juglandis]OAH79088.1 hypothetical protein AXA70_08710 [Xanthomonas arboricola pv. juglandis]CAD7349980.1 hypothetical protein X12_003746 [Xanthomonas arboricola]
MDITMAKKSDAKRKAKLKERRKQAEAAQSKTLAAPSEVGAWFAAHDAEPNIMAELVTEDGALFAYVEGDGNEWTLIVEDNPVAGTSDEIVALGMLLNVAVDGLATGNTSRLHFSQWLAQEIDERCEAAGIDWSSFARSLLPPEKRLLLLPAVQAI